MNIMKDAKALGKAIKHKQSTIEVEGDLAKHVIRIKATGAVAWGVCIIAMAIAVTSIVTAPATAPETAGASLAFSLIPTMPVVTTTLGMGTTIAAVTIAVAGGGVGVLNELRDYDMKKISNSKLILIRKYQKK